MSGFYKKIYIGYVSTKELGYKTNRKAHIHCRIEFDKDNNLSIAGVIGALPSGNAIGSAGQCQDSIEEYNKKNKIVYATDWDKKKVQKLIDVWGRWHLNDMKPNCAHQVGKDWDTSKQISLYYFVRTKDTVEKIIKSRERAGEAIKNGTFFMPSKEETFLANLPRELVLSTDKVNRKYKKFYEPRKPLYQNDYHNVPVKTERAGWVRATEHPEGLLCKPCSVCGYEYGSAWKKEEVPQDVIEFLKSLPEAEVRCAWTSY